MLECIFKIINTVVLVLVENYKHSKHITKEPRDHIHKAPHVKKTDVKGKLWDWITTKPENITT